MNLKQILFSDFDYTLFEHGNSGETSANLLAIKKWRKNGNLFVITTGRGFVSLSLEFPYYREYADYLILNDGATIVSPETGLIKSDRFSKKLTDDVGDALASIKLKDGYGLVSYLGSKEYPFVKEGCYKFRMWLSNDDDVNTVEKLFDRQFSRKLRYITYRDVAFNHDLRLPWINDSYTHSIEVNLHGTDKGTAVRDLLDRLNYCNNTRNVITIGDDRNDLSMLEPYNGYTLDHAHPDLLRRIPSTHVVPHLHNLIAARLSLS